MRIFLDDERSPNGRGWVIVRTYEEFVAVMNERGDEVTEVSFDHDLGTEKEGKDALKFLIDLAIDEDLRVHALRRFVFHSANDVGRGNMIFDATCAQKNGFFTEVELIERPVTLDPSYAKVEK